MKIVNKNSYKIMYGLDFLNPNEPKEIEDKIAKQLLELPNVEKFVDVEEADKLAKENEELKKQLASAKKETKSAKKGK